MDLAEYQQSLRPFDQDTAQDLALRSDWIEKKGLPWLWSELGSIIGRNIKPLSPEDAIRQGLERTPVDRQKMPLKDSYHIAHLTMLDAEAKRICAAAVRFRQAPNTFAPNATISELQGALQEILLDGLVLLHKAHEALKETPNPYLIITRGADHPFEIFKGAEQFIYGRYSGLTHVDRAPFAPIAALRTAIEIRMRSAFGIYCYIDASNNSLRPIDLSQLFEEIKKHLTQITFAIDFHDVVRIYGWSNAYLHAARRDAVWIPGYALQYLRPLFADPGQTPSGGWDINGGIRMPRNAWRSIRTAFDIASRPRKRGLRRFWELLCDAWTAAYVVFTRDRRNRRLQLNVAEEDMAHCVFLD
jgi:hypothetical protein